MAQGEFTKEEAQTTREAVEEMFDAIPKTKRINFIGHLNDILLFLTAAKNAAPSENERKK
ncbi:MAG: hypothetical protein HUU29_00220 [Planctomycetaceae bacterium]|nr:hypothetical protein [Planctomycetaceae bacterium]